MDSESTLTIDQLGNNFWKNKEGKLHRLDGPAVEWIDGTRFWYQNGLRHRLDGPAITNKGRYKMWYVHGRHHREDGPAFISINGYREWWLNDLEYDTKEKYLDALSDEAKMKCLFSEDFLNE
jgi:hypothetical protein